MPFDGREYSDGIPVRKGAYHPDNVHSTVVLATNQRNAMFVGRFQGRSMLAHSWPFNLIRPDSAFHDSSEVIQSLSPVMIPPWARNVRGHWTHAMIHATWSVRDVAGDATELRFSAGNDGGALDTATQLVPLGPGSDHRIPEGALFEARGGAYEAIVEVPFANVSPPATVVFRLEAMTTGTTAAGTAAVPMRFDSISSWLESRG